MISLPHPQHNVYLPSQDEIQSRCVEIQSTWTPSEKDRRLVGSGKKVYSPRIVTCHVDIEHLEWAAN